LLPVAATVIASTAASEHSHPKMKATPLRVPLGVEHDDVGGEREGVEGDGDPDDHEIDDHRASPARDALAACTA